jgi:hypothetical protein
MDDDHNDPNAWSLARIYTTICQLRDEVQQMNDLHRDLLIDTVPHLRMIRQELLEMEHQIMPTDDNHPFRRVRHSRERLPTDPDENVLRPPLFTHKGRHRYDKHKIELEPIFDHIFPNWEPDSYRRYVLPLANLPKTTAHYWLHKWRKDPQWRPWNMKENHGTHNRIFNDWEEAEIKEIIVSQYLEVGKFFTSATFEAVAREKWRDSGRDPDAFVCSKKFISGFRKRNAFTSRKCYLKRRERGATGQNIEIWTRNIQHLIVQHEINGTLDLVVNCDETAWRLVPTGLMTWAPVGAENVRVDPGTNEKDSVTILASVTADGQKLPLFAIAKGKTKQVERSQLGTATTIVTDHSPSGWTTKETFEHYLRWLAQHYGDRISCNRPLNLILDCFSVHRSSDITGLAASLNIKLRFIPAGHTDELQPLDRAVFGAMKAVFRRRFESLRRQFPNDRVTKSDAIQILIDIWDNLSPASISKGWSIYTDDFGPDEDTLNVQLEE